MQSAFPALPVSGTVINERLWQVAQYRARFLSHLVAYLLVNAGLWVVYFVGPESPETGKLPWPLLTMLFWGLGLAIQGVKAYLPLNRADLAQREYKRLLAQPE